MYGYNAGQIDFCKVFFKDDVKYFLKITVIQYYDCILLMFTFGYFNSFHFNYIKKPF